MKNLYLSKRFESKFERNKSWELLGGLPKFPCLVCLIGWLLSSAVGRFPRRTALQRDEQDGDAIRKNIFNFEVLLVYKL